MSSGARETSRASRRELFQNIYNGQLGTGDDIHTQTITMSFESSSQLGNFGMGTRGSIPRGPIDNSIGNNVANGNFRDFDHNSRNARSAANAIAALDAFIAAGNSIGSPARDARAKSFAYFALGYATASIALVYDSAAIVTAAVPVNEVPVLSPASEVMARRPRGVRLRARHFQQRCGDDWSRRLADSAGMAVVFRHIDNESRRWQRLIRSYRAKFRAGVARTPTERAAVDWAAVIADATNGITADFIVNANATTGWTGAVQNQLAVSTGWSQMSPFLLGMADTAGSYDAWLQQALTARTPFLLRTPDRRFPAGVDRAAQQVASGGASRSGIPAGSILYFRNRPTGEDTPSEPWGTWFYDNHRSWHIRAAGVNGPYVMFAKVENDMLAAEGQLRTGQLAAAVALINVSRTCAQVWPTIGPVAAITDQVPGGTGCVPRVPQPPNYTSTACGTILRGDEI